MSYSTMVINYKMTRQVRQIEPKLPKNFFKRDMIFEAYKVLRINGITDFCKESLIPDSFLTRLILFSSISESDLENLIIKYANILNMSKKVTQDELKDISRIWGILGGAGFSNKAWCKLSFALLIRESFKNSNIEHDLLYTTSQIDTIIRAKKFTKFVTNSLVDFLRHGGDIKTSDYLEDKSLESIIYPIYVRIICKLFAYHSKSQDETLFKSDNISANLNVAEIFVTEQINTEIIEIQFDSIRFYIDNLLLNKTIDELTDKNRTLIKENKKKARIELKLESAENQIKGLSETISLLKQQLSEVSNVEKNNEEMESIKSDLGKHKNLCVKLQSDLDEMSEMCDILQKEADSYKPYKRFYDEFKSIQEAETECISDDVDLPLLRSIRVIIFGGFEQWQRNMSKWLEENKINHKVVRTNSVVDMPTLSSKDLVIFNLRNTEHPVTYHIVDTVKSRGAILYRTFSSDVTLVMRGAYGTLIKNWG